MKNFIDIEKIESIENPIIIDVRTGDDNFTGYELYKKSHVQGAYYMDIDKGQEVEQVQN